MQRTVFITSGIFYTTKLVFDTSLTVNDKIVIWYKKSTDVYFTIEKNVYIDKSLIKHWKDIVIYGGVDTRRRYVCSISDAVLSDSVVSVICALLTPVFRYLKIFFQNLRLQLTADSIKSSLLKIVYLKNNGQCAELRLCFDLCVFCIFLLRAPLPFTQAAENWNQLQQTSVFRVPLPQVPEPSRGSEEGPLVRHKQARHCLHHRRLQVSFSCRYPRTASFCPSGSGFSVRTRLDDRLLRSFCSVAGYGWDYPDSEFRDLPLSFPEFLCSRLLLLVLTDGGFGLSPAGVQVKHRTPAHISSAFSFLTPGKFIWLYFCSTFKKSQPFYETYFWIWI